MDRRIKIVKRLMKNQGLNQSQLASKLHVSRQAVSCWLNEKRKFPEYLLPRMRLVFKTTKRQSGL